MRLVGLSVVAAAMLAAAGPAVCATTAAPMPTGDVKLMPHHAEYTMSLNSTKMSGTGVAGASGKMSYRFADSCDGWTVENKTAVTFAYSDGAPVATVWDYVTWESKDGLRFRFHVRSLRDGAVNEEIAGSAMLDAKDKGGTVRFTQPEQKTMSLPAGTVFPTDHTIRLLEAAEKGTRVLAKVVFDGTDANGPFNVTGVVTRLVPANSNTSPAIGKVGVNATMLTAPSWFMQLAFFPQGSTEAEPDYEVGLRYYANGISDEMIQSYGDFTLKATLDKLEPLHKPDC
jgi:hypothetical protein